MSKIVIIGAGGVGNVVARKCAGLPEVFSDIVLASRTLSKCDALAEQIAADSGRRMRTAQVDADNVPELVRAADPASDHNWSSTWRCPTRT